MRGEAGLLFADVARIRFELPGGEAKRMGIPADETTFFGSGRLIGHNLVLTARHVLETRDGIPLPDKGWEVRLVSDQVRSGYWNGEPIDARVIWRAQAGLDVALLELFGVERRPVAGGLRVGSYDRVSVPASCWIGGFPYAARDSPSDPKAYGFSAGLRAGAPGDPYRLAVTTADAPAVHQDWRGVSGGCVLFSSGDTIWLLGVVQHVPKQFGAGALEAARLDAAWADAGWTSEISSRWKLTQARPEALDHLVEGNATSQERQVLSADAVVEIWQRLRAADNESAGRQLEQLGQQLQVTTGMLQAVFAVVLAQDVRAEQVSEKFGEVLAKLTTLTSAASDSEASNATVANLHRAVAEAVRHGQLGAAAERLKMARAAALAAHEQTQIDLAETASLEGHLCLGQLDYRGALEHFSEAVRWTPETRTDMQISYLLQEGKAALDIGLVDHAAQAFEAASAAGRRVYGEAHPLAITTDTWVAEALIKQRRFREAEELLRDAVAAYHGLGLEAQANLARTLNTLGTVFQNTGRRGEALRSRRQALAIGLRALGRWHSDVAIWLNNIATLHAEAGRLNAAIRLGRRALRIDLATVGDLAPTTMSHRSNLGQYLWATGEDEEAEAMLRAAMFGARALSGPHSPLAIFRATTLAGLLLDAGRLVEAEHVLQDAVPGLEALTSASPQAILCRNALGRLYLETGRLKEAEEYLHAAVAGVTSMNVGTSDAGTATILANLATLYRETRRLTKARSMMDAALDILRRSSFSQPRAWRVHLADAKLSVSEGRLPEAAAAYARALLLLEGKPGRIALRHRQTIEQSMHSVSKAPSSYGEA